MPHAYRRYLINCFHRRLDLTGTPLRLEFRTGTNPYAGRRSRLTLSQQRKRARLKQYMGRKSLILRTNPLMIQSMIVKDSKPLSKTSCFLRITN